MPVVPVTTYAQLSVNSDSDATPIGILAPSEAGADPSSLTVTVKGLPQNGTVSLDGTAVAMGQAMSVSDLTSLTFTPGSFGQTYDFIYTVTDAAGHSVDGAASLGIIGGDYSPVLSTPNVQVDSGTTTPLGIQAPVNPQQVAAINAIIVDSLPITGTVTLADGVTAINVGEELSLSQLTGLRFTPNPGVSNVCDTFSYDVFNYPVGYGTGTVTLSIDAAGSPIVSSSRVPVTENTQTALNITPPSDPNYDASQLSITVTSPPGNGAVTLADGVTAVTAGETLSVGQLTGLLFTPAAGTSNTSGAFAYSVADPAGNVSAGSVTLAVSGATDGLEVSSANVAVIENTQTALGITAPTDPNYAASALTITVIGLPSNGIITLADGTTAVTSGETLTLAQLTGLLFTPTAGLFGASSAFTYTVADPTGNSSTGTVSLAIGGPVGNPVAQSPNVAVTENTQAPLGISPPSDPNYDAAALTITVTGLPGSGVVTLADGTTPVTSDEMLTLAELTGLLFDPTPGLSNTNDTFSYTIADPAGHSATGTATLSIAATASSPTAPSSDVAATENTSVALGISAPNDPNYDASALAITVTSLPSDGTVTLADGTTAAISGETLSVGQLTGLLFTPTAHLFGASGTFAYTVTDPSGQSAGGSASLTIGPAIGDPTVGTAIVPVSENTLAPLGIQAPTDPNYPASDLTITVTGLPSNGTITLANGTTLVTSGETLNVGQLSSLLFNPTPGFFNSSSSFTYTVTDPAENASTGAMTLAIGNAIGDPSVSSPSLTVVENSGPTPIGIAAPTDPNYSPAALVITASSLPSDGTITLANGTAVSAGENLTIAQLTGLQFTPTDVQFGQTSAFTYSVTDPTGNSSTGAAALSIGPSLDVDPVTQAALPVIDPDLNGGFDITNADTGRSGANNGTSYTGPLPNVDQQLIWPGTQSIAVRAEIPGVFTQGGSADDALEATGGSNVLDGGAGSNFLIGASGSDGGTDQFYADASGPGVTWNTLVNFHQGDSVTIWGFQQGVSTDSWTASAGAAGYQGATLNFEMAGAGSAVDSSLTFAGMTQQAAATNLSMSAGTDDGKNYLQITYTT